MFKYVMTFSKTGTICYTSHLDLMRVFHRVFKRAGIRLAYSQGFNPHPKMSFAQPLSLGYWGMKEMLEFDTETDFQPEELESLLKSQMPEGLDIISCKRLEDTKRTLAAQTVAAEYMIVIPLKEKMTMDAEEMRKSYLGQGNIIALKKQKKKKELAEVDIRPMIRSFNITKGEDSLFIQTVLDSGSSSNLSPELLISTFISHMSLDVERSEIQVMRKEIIFE